MGEKGSCCQEVQAEMTRRVSGCRGPTFSGATGRAQVCRKRRRATVRRRQSLLTLGRGCRCYLNFFNKLGILQTKNEKYSMGSSLMITYTSSCGKVRLCGFHQSLSNKKKPKTPEFPNKWKEHYTCADRFSFFLTQPPFCHFLARRVHGVSGDTSL